MNKTKKLVPDLRFPEFSGEWEMMGLDEVCSFHKGKGISKADISENGIECIRYGELYTTYNEIIKNIVSKTNCNIKDLILSNENDIILPSSGETAIDISTASCVINKKIALGGDINIIRSKENGIFLAYYLNNVKKKDIARLSQGISVIHLYNTQLKELKINLPSLPEQEKIASFLTKIDEKIEKLERKKELWVDYKKGVMQGIFSRDIRFKDDEGNNFPDWEEKRLGEIVLEYKLGGNYKNTIIQTKNPLIKMGNINRGNININKIEYIDETEEIQKKDLIKYGDLFFNTRNTLDLVGKVAIWRNELDKAYYNSNLMRITFKNNFFMNYYLNSHQALSQLKAFATGTTSVAAIYTRDLLTLKIKLSSLPEQEKIANFLSSLDTKIDVLEREIEKNKGFKRGLLQGLFV